MQKFNRCQECLCIGCFQFYCEACFCCGVKPDGLPNNFHRVCACYVKRDAS
jgi:hypothetical protein